MYFDSLQALLHMDGHGPFVWACYAMAMFVFSGLALSTRAHSKRAIELIRASESTDEQAQ